MRKIGIYFHAEQQAGRALAAELRATLDAVDGEVWSCSVWDEAGREHVAGTDVIVCIGGDGTMLRAARVAAPFGVPLLGVNTGRLGFLAELDPDELQARLPAVLGGEGRIEERAMLSVDVRSNLMTAPVRLDALNDVVVGRRSIGRPVYVEVDVDGTAFTTYRADAVIAASATGSTGYNLSAHGPVLHPEMRALVLTPVAPHLSMARSAVLPAESRIDLVVRSDHVSALSVDGQEDIPLEDGDTVHVRLAEHSARFLRLGPAERFWATVGERLASATNARAKEFFREELGAP